MYSFSPTHISITWIKIGAFTFSAWVWILILSSMVCTLTFLLIRNRFQRKKIMDFMEKRTKTILSQTKKIAKQKEQLEEENIKSEALLKDVFPEKIAEILKNKGKISPEYYPQASILFADFVSFSKLTPDLTAEELVDNLNLYFKEFDKAITENKMILIKTIGDSYFAVGGIPKKNWKNPIYTVLAGLQMQHSVKEINDSKKSDWSVRVGINTGEIAAGVLDTKRPMFDVWGSAVNVASRVQEAGEPGKVNISEATYSEIYPFFDCEERGIINTKNVGEIPMYFVKKIKSELSADEEGMKPNKMFWQYATSLSKIEPDYISMTRDIIKLIKDNLKSNIYYHTEKHALNVMNAVEFLGFGEEIYNEDILLLKTAVLFHDVGFIEKYDANEEIGASYARKLMPKYGFNEDQIEKVARLIIATKANHEAQDILEEIMKDADLDYLGRDDFEVISQKLMMEFIENNKINTKNDFLKIQVEFLKTHYFLTDTAKSSRVEKKKQNIKKAIELYNSQT